MTKIKQLSTNLEIENKKAIHKKEKITYNINDKQQNHYTFQRESLQIENNFM